jgi:hypothetical protein
MKAQQLNEEIMKIKKNLAISDTGFVFDPSTGDSYTLNPVGLELIQLIKSGQDLPAITTHITGKYDVDAIAFERYYLDFIATLRQMHLIDDNA